ncbi:MAG: CPBP family intramembrane glutamic endopeptidase [Cyclobacteriaceae bacterium]
MNTIDYSIIAAIIVGVLFPLYAVLTSKKTIEKLEENPEALADVYKGTILALGIITLTVAAAIKIERVPLEVVGLEFIRNPIWILALLISSGIAFFLISKIRIPEDKIESARKSLEGVRHILPKNRREYRWMMATAFVAGIFEEVVFRGFLVWIVGLHVHISIAILGVNILFGVAHATTKLNNAVKAFGLGLFFSMIYYFTGSLWLAMLTHIIVDLYAGTFSYKFSQLETD